MTSRPISVVEIWHARVPRSGAESSLEHMLSSQECARAAQIKDPLKRTLYYYAHTGLRKVLGLRLGCAAQDVPITTEINGKPRLEGASQPLNFNLSHSGNRFVIALCPNAQIGVDIEACRSVRQARCIVARFFAPEERAALQELDETRFRDAFIRLWTLKEAFIKATGEGFSRPFASFAIDWQASRLLHGRSGDPKILAPFYVGANYFGSLALCSDYPFRVLHHRLHLNYYR